MDYLKQLKSKASRVEQLEEKLADTANWLGGSIILNIVLIMALCAIYGYQS